MQDHITNIGDIELEPIESQKIMGIVKLIISHFVDTSSEDLELRSNGRMCHAQPKDIRPEKVGRDENKQEINNKCLKCSKEFNNLEDLRIHENKCYICEQCTNWYEH